MELLDGHVPERGGEAELEAFLRDQVPTLEHLLLRNLASSAFDAADEMCRRDERVTCLHSLRHGADQGAAGSMAAIESCTSVAWNASATMLAAAYGDLNRNEWASSESQLCAWSLDGSQLDPARADVVMPLHECLSCLAFHPEDPSLLAGGAFNGDVLLWNLAAADEDKLLAQTCLDAFSHHEPVQQVVWTKLASKLALCSISSDGKLLIWGPRLQQPLMGFRLRPAATLRQPSRSPAETVISGATAIGFSRQEPSIFVAGLEGGQLYKCSLLANEQRAVEDVLTQRSELPWSAAAAALLTRVAEPLYSRLKLRVEKEAMLARDKEVHPSKIYAVAAYTAEEQPFGGARLTPSEKLFGSPVSFAYEGHSGPIYGVSCSPYHRNVFLSVSTDTSVRLFNMLHPTPLLVTEPCSASLFACEWSPSRPLVFAVGAANGCVYIYDLRRKQRCPVARIQVTNDGSAVYGVAFSPVSGELLATADAQGRVKIWRLSQELSTMAPHEREQLSEFVLARGPGGGESIGEEEAHGEGGESHGESR